MNNFVHECRGMVLTESPHVMVRGNKKRLMRIDEWKHLLALLRLWQQRARARRQLMSMSDHLLKDIGLSRYEAMREGGKPFWQ